MQLNQIEAGKVEKRLKHVYWFTALEQHSEINISTFFDCEEVKHAEEEVEEKFFFFVCSPEAKKTRGDKARKALVATCKAFCCERKEMTEDKVDERNDFFLSTHRERLSSGGVTAAREEECLWSSEEEIKFLASRPSSSSVLFRHQLTLRHGDQTACE